MQLARAKVSLLPAPGGNDAGADRVEAAGSLCRSYSELTMSEAVLILGVGTAVFAILFGARVAMRTAAGGTSQQLDTSDISAADGSSAFDVAGVIALPPIIFLAFLVAATVLEAIVPSPCWSSMRSPAIWPAHCWR
jgi:hypothetical protein